MNSTPETPAWPSPQTASAMYPIAPAPPSQRRRGLLISMALLAIAALVTAAALIGYNSGISSGDDHYRPLLNQAEADRDTARAAQAALENARDEEKADQKAAAAEVPDLKEIADRHFSGNVDLTGSADYLEVTITNGNATATGPALSAFLDELGFTPAVLERMSKTRALDGTLTAEGHNCNVSWTYHPDDGLQLVFEASAAG